MLRAGTLILFWASIAAADTRPCPFCRHDLEAGVREAWVERFRCGGCDASVKVYSDGSLNATAVVDGKRRVLVQVPPHLVPDEPEPRGNRGRRIRSREYVGLSPHPIDRMNHPVERPGHPVERPGHPVERPGEPVGRMDHPVRRPSHPVQRPGHPVRRPGPPVARPNHPVGRMNHPVLPPGVAVTRPGHPVLRPGAPLGRIRSVGGGRRPGVSNVPRFLNRRYAPPRKYDARPRRYAPARTYGSKAATGARGAKRGRRYR